LNLRPPGYEQGEPCLIRPDPSPPSPFVALASASTSHPSLPMPLRPVASWSRIWSLVPANDVGALAANLLMQPQLHLMRASTRQHRRASAVKTTLPAVRSRLQRGRHRQRHRRPRPLLQVGTFRSQDDWQVDSSQAGARSSTWRCTVEPSATSAVTATSRLARRVQGVSTGDPRPQPRAGPALGSVRLTV